ncbi:hypothetical protein [Craterilacuibacter sp.]|uniref:hypothetical protein n=1 Tax=Craterilacuibacter sp. TaxID=2870909 RepID=UPI003F3AE16B
MKSNKILWLILALCMAPVLASSVLYFAYPPAGGKSYGTLLPTQSLAIAKTSAWPKGKWVLMNTAHAPCDTLCQQQRFDLGQIHTAQNEGSERLEVLTLFNAGAALDRSHVEILVGDERLLRPGLTLVDPLGNQVLNYPAGSDPTRIIREVAKVMKSNNGLG